MADTVFIDLTYKETLGVKALGVARHTTLRQQVKALDSIDFDLHASEVMVGLVVKVSKLLGKKNIKTDEPTEKIGTT